MSLSHIKREITGRAELSFPVCLQCLGQSLALNTGPESVVRLAFQRMRMLYIMLLALNNRETWLLIIK